MDFEGESEMSWEKAGFFGMFQTEGKPRQRLRGT